MNKEEVLKQFNKSGFPFQLRVEHDIAASSSQHHWSVVSREHPWSNADDTSSGFIDLVLSHQDNCARLLIECKRVKSEDSRQLQWLFLLPDHNMYETKQASSFEVIGTFKTDKWKDLRIWDDVSVVPSSLESEFCILMGDDPKRQPLLASHCAELLESVEGLAQEEIAIQRSQGLDVRLFLFPVIVTNAKLTTCRFRAQDVRLNDGSINLADIETNEVPFIRFRKSLTTTFGKEIRSLKEAHAASQRTVFIVNGQRIGEFLYDWDFSPRSGSYAIQRIVL